MSISSINEQQTLKSKYPSSRRLGILERNCQEFSALQMDRELAISTEVICTGSSMAIVNILNLQVRSIDLNVTNCFKGSVY